MAVELFVAAPFSGYARGQVITDPGAVASILAGPYADFVNQVVLPSGGGLNQNILAGVPSAVQVGTAITGTYQSAAFGQYVCVRIGGIDLLPRTMLPGLSGALPTLVSGVSGNGTLAMYAGQTGGSPIAETSPILFTAGASGGGASYYAGAGISLNNNIFSLGTVPLSDLDTAGAVAGQALTLVNGVWTPTTLSAGTTFTGVAPISVTNGVVSLVQSGAIAGQALVWNGTSWAPSTIYSGIVIPAAAGALLGATSTAGTATTITLGSGLSLSGSVLSATSTASALAGISINGSTIVASTNSPYQMLTADRVVDVNKTTGAATKILLPTNPTLWVDYTIIDGKGDSGTNNITVAVGSGTINGASSFIISSNNAALSLRAVSATVWKIV